MVTARVFHFNAMLFKIPFLIRLFPAFLLLAACSAPRAIIHSGKVTSKGTVKVGGTMLANVASETAYRLGKITVDAVKAIETEDTVLVDNTVRNAAAGAISYALDPTGINYDLYLRVGVAKRFDMGYKYAFGPQALDVRYQFLGPTGTPANPGEGSFYGSIGVQYSWQRADLPNIIEDLSPLLEFTAKRKDLVVPLVFSWALGPEEEFGHLAFGAVYQRSFIKYGFAPGSLFNKASDDVLEQVPAYEKKRGYNAWGGFVNMKVGYRYFYFLPALSIYYQNYGRYQLPAGYEVKLSGVTVVPSLGVEVWIWKGGKKKKQ